MRRFAVQDSYNNVTQVIYGEYVKLVDVKILLRQVKQHLESDLHDFEEEKLLKKINEVIDYKIY